MSTENNNSTNRCDRQAELDKVLALHVKWLEDSDSYVGRRADLSGAWLAGASLRGANLQHADMSYATLTGADLTGADLRYVNLTGADLTGADLTGAQTCRASLGLTNLDGAKLPSPIVDLTACKVGYKKVWNGDRTERVVIELRFPKGTKLTSTIFGRKCRASRALVAQCVTPGHENETEFRSLYDNSFVYRVGETAKPTKRFNNSSTIECTSGIHFFVTEEEAENYDY